MAATATLLPASRVDLYRSLASACAHVGLPFDAVQRFAAAHYFPVPKQLFFHAAAHEADHANGPTDIGIGGARGGAKSHGVLAQLALDDCQRQDGLKCLWLRQVGIAAKEALEDLMPRVLRIPHSYAASPVPTIRFPNGSRIIVGHFNSDSDVNRYLGLEYDVIATEEATQLSAMKNAQIGTCLRTSKPGWRVRRYYTTNPGGVGHQHFKKQFIEPFRRGIEKETRFIPSSFRDNPYLNSDYVTTLDRLTGWLRAAWRDGDWDIAAGQFFSTWRHDQIVIPARVVDEIRSHWPVWCSLDYGFTHPTVCHLFTQFDGRTYVVDEYHVAKRLPSQNAFGIHAMLQRHNVNAARLSRFVAGADVFANRGDSGGKTIADQYREAGLRLQPAIMDRINGWGEVLKLLGDPERGIEPKLGISERCQKLIECIPAMQHDPNRPEDVLKVDVDDDGQGGDDSVDCLRYGVTKAERKFSVGTATIGS